MKVYIIGITGVGKSSLGKKLARKLGYSFVDLDAWIEIREELRINQIFQIGEDHFRDCETSALKSLLSYDDMVVATGGGAVLRRENIEIMRKTGVVIHIHRPISHIAGAISTKRRPLLQKNPYHLYELYHQRKPLYQKARHYRIDGRYKSKAINKMVKIVEYYEDED